MGLELFGGVALGGELRVEDEDGSRIEQEEYDAAPLVGIRGIFRF